MLTATNARETNQEQAESKHVKPSAFMCGLSNIEYLNIDEVKLFYQEICFLHTSYFEIGIVPLFIYFNMFKYTIKP